MNQLFSQNSMIINQAVTVSPDVFSQEVAGETVLLDLKTEQYMGLNEVGTRVWQLLQNEANLDVIFKTLLEEYDVESDILQHDLHTLIVEMAAAQLVTVAKL